MRRLAIAVMVLSWLTGTEVSASQTAPGRFGIPYWKPIGAWIVLLLPLGNGGMACTALTRMIAAPAGKYSAGKYSIGFALSPSATHFYLNDPALPKPAPHTVSLAVDGRHLADLKVLLNEPFDDGEQLLMADLPGAMLAERILPVMVKGQTLQVAAANRHYTIPITDFESVVGELQQCAVAALAKQPRLSSDLR